MQVKQRQTVDHGVVAGPLPRVGDGVDTGRQCPVAEVDTLGSAGGSRGVQDHGDGVGGRRAAQFAAPAPPL